MLKNVISNAIKNKLNQLERDNNSIIILKGISMSVVDEVVSRINLSEIVENKLGYFISVFGKRKFLSYEEFLLLADFVVSQYKEVYVLNNNIYMEQYPIEECFQEDIREGLLNHFKESDEDDESAIGDIDEYISIFQGLKEYKDYLIGVYSQLPILASNKIIEIDIFDKHQQEMIPLDGVSNFIELIEESDFVNLVKLLYTEPEKIYVRISNYIGDIKRLKEHITLIAYYCKKCTEICLLQSQKLQEGFEHKVEFGQILEKYWGHPTYRKLQVYDMDKLEQGIKKIVEVSQEDIISNLVQQVEKCEKGDDFRDIFVTAPTGAGKSVMFQVPAIYMAEKNPDLLTIVISPLIGLMNDQVKNLELKNYKYAKTINSDISPIIKQDIIDRVAEKQIHILYISPETLLSRSDIEQLIGNRTIGMLIIDEAHIVTTWGKQFRPDYWYLGDYIRQLRKKQIEKKGRSFVVATFTATAIYHGIEDMYTETINSLHMLSPFTYLGYVKRNDIDIKINKMKKVKGTRTEYEIDKFEKIEELLRRAIITNKKTLIYFPTVALINRCYEYLRNKREIEHVTVYYGTLSKDKKQESYEKFYAKEKLVMLATKAFGMGIDIDDIEIVAHFSPTGNVCDYVQEIGRAARRENLQGEALYNYDKRDFKHINRLHGMSTIQPYQLVKVIEKIDELYQNNLQRKNRKDFTKKRNAMLLDAENFSYIFKSPVSDEDSSINKVKTALLLIQKDFENRVGFSPIKVRPIPMFSIGFFKIEPGIQARLTRRYSGAVEEIEDKRHICRVLLSEIWNKDYRSVSFPKFKYMLYTRDAELDFNLKYTVMPALCVSIKYANDYDALFKKVWDSLKYFIFKKVQSSEHTAISEIAAAVSTECSINKYKAYAICEVVIASMDSYRKNFARSTTPIVQEKTTISGTTKYQFNVAVNSYFKWIESGIRGIERETVDGRLFLINDFGSKTKEYSIILGVLESMSVLSFEMLGGANSQLYIYINQIQALKNILNAPYRYRNRLLDTISERHLISVKMLTYLYEGDFTNEKLWDLLEDYFLGVIPESVKLACLEEKADMKFD